MHARLQEFAKSFGIKDMKLRERSPNTRRALAIAEHARDQDRLEPWRRLAMEGHWRRGLNLESDADLRSLAVEAGLHPDAAISASRDPRYLGRIDEKRAEAESLGVSGIPTFVVGDHGVVGCQPHEVLARFVDDAGARKR
jgi:predicted DsbA family dithiol-disulfide isomerase